MSNKFFRVLAYVYGGIITWTAVGGVAGEAFMLPGGYKLLVWTWVPLIVAYWLYLGKSNGNNTFWKVVAVLVLASDLFLNTVVVKESSEILPVVLSVFVLSPLYAAIILYAFSSKKRPNTTIAI